MNDEIYMLKKTTRGYLVKLDPEDFYKLLNYKISVSHQKGKPVAVSCWEKGGPWSVIKPVHIPHFILKNNTSQIIDHINRDVFDNRKNNLRLVTKRQNNMNRETHLKKIFFYGVFPSVKEKYLRFKAHFSVKRHKKSISFEFSMVGLFLACIAHDKLVVEHNDEDYAPLNFCMFKIPSFKKILLKTDLRLLRRKYVKRANSICKKKRPKAHNPIH